MPDVGWLAVVVSLIIYSDRNYQMGNSLLNVVFLLASLFIWFLATYSRLAMRTEYYSLPNPEPKDRLFTIYRFQSMRVTHCHWQSYTSKTRSVYKSSVRPTRPQIKRLKSMRVMFSKLVVRVCAARIVNGTLDCFAIYRILAFMQIKQPTKPDPIRHGERQQQRFISTFLDCVQQSLSEARAVFSVAHFSATTSRTFNMSSNKWRRILWQPYTIKGYGYTATYNSLSGEWTKKIQRNSGESMRNWNVPAPESYGLSV